MCTVAAAFGAAGVRVWQITSWRRGPRGGRPPPEGASVAYAPGRQEGDGKGRGGPRDARALRQEKGWAGLLDECPTRGQCSDPGASESYVLSNVLNHPAVGERIGKR